MKRLIAGAALLVLADGSLANGWDVRNDLGLLYSQEAPREVLALMSTKEEDMTGFVVTAQNACDQFSISPHEKRRIPSIKWNNVSVKMEANCILSNFVLLQPETESGKSYVLKLISGNQNLTAEFPSGGVVKFENPNGSSAIKKIFKSREGI